MNLLCKSKSNFPFDSWNEGPTKKSCNTPQGRIRFNFDHDDDGQDDE